MNWDRQDRYDLFGVYNEVLRGHECAVCYKPLKKGEKEIRIPRLHMPLTKGAHVMCYMVAMKKAIDFLDRTGLH